MARDKSIDGREALVESISDLFFGTDKILSDRERMLMSEILRQLVRNVETSARKLLAERLVELPNAPRDLILLLANDEIEVAHAILAKSTVLHDEDLIEVIRQRTTEHQLAITIRSRLSSNVTDALVATGNASVIKSLLENPNASLAQRTLEYLVEQSQRVDAYQYPLLQRRELGPELAARMYGWVTDALKTYITGRYQIDPAKISEMTRSVATQLTLGHPTARSKSDVLADELSRVGSVTPTLLLRTLREGEIDLFISLLSRFTKLNTVFVRRVLFDRGTESLSVVCRGAGIEREVFRSIVMTMAEVPRAGARRTLSDIAASLTFFDRVSPDAAQKMLLKWQQEHAVSSGSLVANAPAMPGVA